MYTKNSSLWIVVDLFVDRRGSSTCPLCIPLTCGLWWAFNLWIAVDHQLVDFGGQQLVDCGGLSTCGLLWTFKLWVVVDLQLVHCVDLQLVGCSGPSTCAL